MLTVTARDAAGNTSTDTLTVTYNPDTTLPAVTITGPTSASTLTVITSPLALSGTASDNIGVTQVTWTNSRGGSGTATGTTSWSVASITLLSGSNVLTVTARDAAGNTRTDTLTVTYSPDTTRPNITITTPDVQFDADHHGSDAHARRNGVGQHRCDARELDEQPRRQRQRHAARRPGRPAALRC